MRYFGIVDGNSVKLTFKVAGIERIRTVVHGKRPDKVGRAVEKFRRCRFRKIAERRAIDVVNFKLCGNRRTCPQFRLYIETAVCGLRRHLEQGDAHSDFARRARRSERIGNAP